MQETLPAGPRSALEALCDEDEILRAISNDTGALGTSPFGDELYRSPPIYFIGDSRSIVFRNRTYVSPFTSRSYQLRSVFLRNLYAADFYTPKTGLTLPLLSVLATDMAILSYDEGATWMASRVDFEANGDGSRLEPGPAPLVLFCGAFDGIRLLDELGPDVDVPAWDEVSSRYDLSTAPASRLVGADEVLERMIALLEPFRLGIQALRAMGFAEIFVHGYPRPQSGDRFARIYGQVKSMRQYHPNGMPKIAILVDQAMRAVAEQSSARYIAGPVNELGELSQDFTWDDVHYNDRGACEVARSVVAILEGAVE